MLEKLSLVVMQGFTYDRSCCLYLSVGYCTQAGLFSCFRDLRDAIYNHRGWSLRWLWEGGEHLGILLLSVIHFYTY